VEYGGRYGGGGGRGGGLPAWLTPGLLSRRVLFALVNKAKSKAGSASGATALFGESAWLMHFLRGPAGFNKHVIQASPSQPSVPLTDPCLTPRETISLRAPQK
jgi:hypothetical protein